jgi:hypothetical protein
MNLEQERKAFEVFYEKEATSAYSEPDLGFKDGDYRCAIASRAFKVWLAAKAHAVEMAKPTCEVYHLTTGWAVDPICREHYEGFASKEKAIEWAVENGYRVVA